MTQIPSGTKFVGISSTVPTPENRSAQNNSTTEIYTLADLQESVLDLTTPPNDGDVLTYDTGTNAPVWAAPAGGSGYTETIVNISSAQILAMGTSPIELLPALDANQYYDVDKIIIEFIKNGSPSTLVWDAGQLISIWDDAQYLCQIDATLFSNQGGTGNSVHIINAYSWKVDSTDKVIIPNNGIGSYSKLSLTTYNSANPTDGGGFSSTARAIITYTVRTFGA